MFDTDLIDGYLVSTVEPKSLVHSILQFIASEEMMSVLKFDTDSPGSTYPLEKNIISEFNLPFSGLDYLVQSGLILSHYYPTGTPSWASRLIYGKRMAITIYGGETLDELNAGEEVVINLG